MLDGETPSLRSAWERHAEEWVAWARTPGHDTYWHFHRDRFLALVPPPGRLTLDVGCGEGRLGRDLVAAGHRLVGVDGSPTMAHASATHPERPLDAIVSDAAALPVASEVADCVVAFMSLQDIDDLEGSVRELARVLRPGGCLAVAIVHPANSAGRVVGARGDPARPFVITGSWFERRRYSDAVARDGLTMTFHSEHRPLQAYVDAAVDAGLMIDRLNEINDPDPADAWHRMPMFLHLRARKPEALGAT